MTVHRTSPEDSRAAGWVDLDDEWEITVLPLVDRRYRLFDGGSVLARNTYADGIAAAVRLGGQLPTPAQLKAKAKLPGAIVLTPFLGTPTAETSLHHSKLHDQYVDDRLREAGWTGAEPAVGAGKHWVDPDDDEETGPDEDADLDDYSHLVGWDKDGAGPGEELWQPRMRAHKGRNHHDDGTTTEVVRRKRKRPMSETPPSDSDEQEPEPEPTKRGDATGPVEAWQLFLQRYFKARGKPDPLPKYGADGDHGGETEKATAKWRELELGEDESLDIYAPIDEVEIISEPPDTLPSPPVMRSVAEIVCLHIASRNFTRAARPKSHRRVIVLHSMEGGTAKSVARWFGGPSSPKASCHFCVGPGVVVRCVPLDHVAWAAPGMNRYGIQVEQEGRAMKTDWLSGDGLATMQTTAELVGALCREEDIPIARLDPDALRVDGCTGITTHWAVTTAFRKSSHVDPGGPGDKRWPWGEFLDLVQRG